MAVPLGRPAIEEGGGARRRWLVTHGAEVAGALVFVVVAALIARRIPTGIDLGDEAYYALFLDDWLKGGIDDSAYLTIHQTAALLLYPFASLYVWVTGSSDGLMLFLRRLYLLGSLASAGVVVAYLRTLGLGGRSWLGGALLVAFIPFGLPAPSYNTIALQAVCVALAGYGCGIAAASRRRTWSWFALSAGAWAVATVAYPPVLLAVGVMGVLLLALRRDTQLEVSRYLAILVGLQAVGWAVVAAVFSGSRLVRSFEYTPSIAAPGGALTRLDRAADIITASGRFELLCIACIVLGVLRRRLTFPVVTVVLAVLVALTFAGPPALFVRSHDIAVLVALTGLGLLGDLRRSARTDEKAVALVYAVSLAAGLATTIFATNLFFNFCIGAAFAAALSLNVRTSGRDRGRAIVAFVAATCVVGAVLATSLRSIYEDRTAAGGARERIDGGFFEGIRVRPGDARLLDLFRSRIEPVIDGQPSVVYVGRNPGLVLTTTARLHMRSSYPLAEPATPADAPAALARQAAFYADERNRPGVVVVYRDPYFAPANPLGPGFPQWYALSETVQSAVGSFEVYRRR